MKLSDLLKYPIELSPKLDESILSITDDSRTVKAGSLFVLRKGVSGADYSNVAIANGAEAVLDLDEKTLKIKGTTLALKDDFDLAELLKSFYEIELEKFKCFGVTGTNGKSTIAMLMHEVLNQQWSESLLLGTLGNGIGANIETSQLTTPGVFDLFQWISKAQNLKGQSLAMEVSSHALDQGRVQGLKFDVAVLTNLTQDHLDYHKTMETYLEAKAKLVSEYLDEKGVAWVWQGDEWLSQIKDSRVRYYGLESADTQVKIISNTDHGIEMEIKIDGVNYHINSPLIGAFNVDNLIGATAAAHSFGISAELVEKAFAQTTIPGRLEPIALTKGKAFVDYAHTPDALKRVLEVAREICQGKLSVVFGCGGDRDKTKRPQMAAIAEGLADRVVVTSDNPRTEDPQSILDDVVAGLKLPEKAMIIADRAQAIQLAVAELEANDLLIVAGKGHEDYQILGTEKIHFDDREVVRACGGLK